LEVINRAAVLLRVPEEHGNSVKVILGGADGPLVYIDASGHIHVLPPQGPGDPELRKAVTGILQGIQAMKFRHRPSPQQTRFDQRRAAWAYSEVAKAAFSCNVPLDQAVAA
jgi:hypothetical protein